MPTFTISMGIRLHKIKFLHLLIICMSFVEKGIAFTCNYSVFYLQNMSIIWIFFICFTNKIFFWRIVFTCKLKIEIYTHFVVFGFTENVSKKLCVFSSRGQLARNGFIFLGTRMVHVFMLNTPATSRYMYKICQWLWSFQ